MSQNIVVISKVYFHVRYLEAMCTRMCSGSEWVGLRDKVLIFYQ